MSQRNKIADKVEHWTCSVCHKPWNILKGLCLVFLACVMIQCSNPIYTSIRVAKNHGDFFVAFGIKEFKKLPKTRQAFLASIDSGGNLITSSQLASNVYDVYNPLEKETYTEFVFKDTLQKCFSQITYSTTPDSPGFFVYIHGFISSKFYKKSDRIIQDSIALSNKRMLLLAKNLRLHILKGDLKRYWDKNDDI